ETVGRPVRSAVRAHAVGDVRQPLKVGEVQRVAWVDEQVRVAAADAGRGLPRADVPRRELIAVAVVARAPDETLGGREPERDARVDRALAVHLHVGLEPRALLVDDDRVREADGAAGRTGD